MNVNSCTLCLATEMTADHEPHIGVAWGEIARLTRDYTDQAMISEDANKADFQVDTAVALRASIYGVQAKLPLPTFQRSLT